jgi:hypothetical protein
MISYAELMALVVFIGMGLYISYLRIELNKSIRAGAMLSMILHDLASGEVEIERTEDGIRIRKDDREVSVHQCRAP